MEWWKGTWKITIQGELLQRDRYQELMGRPPLQKYSPGSEGYKQWTYNPRTKAGREYLAKAFEQKLSVRKKQRTKGKNKATKKTKRIRIV